MSQLSFRYVAIDDRGARAKGVLEARSPDDAYRKITAAGMKPLRISSKARRRRGKRITLKDLSQFSHQFSVLIEARMTTAPH